ncbi:hypothetical protein [Pseudomonas sp. RIT-To-2]|uniref:hypothetical protein n=1 Tax=Pseudomonas sp. RIT-To-2 TaxID=3462541 RepID=UPI002412F0C3
MGHFRSIPLARPLRPYKGKRLSLFGAPVAPNAPPLLAPSVPDAVEAPGYPRYIVDNSKGQASSPVAIEIPWNEDFLPAFGSYPADTVQLLLDGRPYGELHEITVEEFDAAAPFTIMLPLAPDDEFDQDHQAYRLQYLANWNVGEGADTSISSVIFIDRVAPGGNLNGQIVLPSVGDDRVVSAGQLDDQRRLLGRVPSYTGEWQGDTITPYIYKGGLYTNLTEFSIQLPPGAVPSVVNLYYPEAALIAAGDGPTLLGYKVKDLAGNESVYSEGTGVVLLLADVPQPDDLLAPVVPLFSDDNIINEADARNLDVLIPAYPHPDPADFIRLYWGGNVVNSGFVGDTTADPIKTFRVLYTSVRDHAANPYRAEVKWDLTRSGAPLGTSPALEVTVDTRLPAGPDPDPETPEHGNLRLPSARGEGSGDLNVISAGQYGKDAQISVPWPAATEDPAVNFAVGDLVTVRWGSTPLPVPAYSISGTDVTNRLPLNFTLTGAQMREEGSGIIPLSYEVARNFPAAGDIPAHTNTAYSNVQEVTVVGTDELPGGGAELPAGNWVRLNSNGALNFENTRNGARYRISLTYVNVAVGDVLNLYFQGYQRTSSTITLPNTYYEATHTVGQGDLGNTWYDFLVPESMFTTVNFPGAVNNVQVKYDATNHAGTGASATSLTLIDLRGSLAQTPDASSTGSSSTVGNATGQTATSPYRSLTASVPDRNAAILAAFTTQLKNGE